MKQCIPEDDHYVYSFRVETAEQPEKIYIKPPILYLDQEISPVLIPLAVGQVAKLDGIDWFSIASVDVVETAQKRSTVKVTIAACSVDLPGMPEVVLGEGHFGGLSSLKFDAEQNFSGGVFMLTVPGGGEDLSSAIADAQLCINDALIRCDASALQYSSSIKSLSVVAE